MRILASVTAVVVGYLTIAILVVISTVVASRAFGIEHRSSSASLVPRGYLVSNLILSFLAAVIGGYVCSWIAPSRPFIHVVVLASLFEALSLAMAVSTGAEPGQPSWYPWVIGVIGVAGVMVGGVLRHPFTWS